jgi:Ni2+-binding GTPase involved in maturation of urease and hydrogenase
MAAPYDAPDRAAPMTSAPFVWREDGRPDWGSMWTSFCDLALHGGPPHRGPGEALRARPDGDAAPAPEIAAEMRRGIWETTGLYADLLAPGWVTVTCESPAMAQWLGAAIAPENVDVRVEDDRVLLPAGPRFRVEDEVKSIITVVAKTHHYWTVHDAGARPPAETAGRPGFRCPACGLECRVSRPEAAADVDVTCPIDGSPMARRDRVAIGRGPSFWHSHGPGQPYHPHEGSAEGGRAGEGVPRPITVGVGGPGGGKTRLIDVLRRRYGRRRAIVAAAGRPIEVSDPAVDLVLVELGGDRETLALAPEMVDATIGVLDTASVAHALGRGDRGLDLWRLLVVSTAGEPALELRRLERDTCARRGRDPVVFVDLATAEGIDAVVAWLQRELLLEPWRERRIQR